jgi:hypothetical protein
MSRRANFKIVLPDVKRETTRNYPLHVWPAAALDRSDLATCEIGLDVHLKALFRQRTAITHLPNTIIKTAAWCVLPVLSDVYKRTPAGRW